jgi:hypothetical protein
MASELSKAIAKGVNLAATETSDKSAPAIDASVKVEKIDTDARLKAIEKGADLVTTDSEIITEKRKKIIHFSLFFSSLPRIRNMCQLSTSLRPRSRTA